MNAFPRQVHQWEYRPEDDEDYGKRGGLTPAPITVKRVSRLDYFRAHCMKLPGSDRVLARLERQERKRTNEG